MSFATFLVPCFMLLGHSQERNMNSRWPMKKRNSSAVSSSLPTAFHSSSYRPDSEFKLLHSCSGCKLH